jgi:hypothetical protein
VDDRLHPFSVGMPRSGSSCGLKGSTNMEGQFEVFGCLQYPWLPHVRGIAFVRFDDRASSPNNADNRSQLLAVT